MAEDSGHALWQVAQNKKTKEIICVNVADDFNLYKKAHVRTKYAIIASLPSREEAENYAQLISANISIDAIMYLRLQRNMLPKVLSGDIPNEKELQSLVSNAQGETGRTCLGMCRSECNQTACRICYNTRFSTWQLCANIRAMNQLKDLVDQATCASEGQA